MNDDIIVSVNVTKATPHHVFIQDKLVAVINFATSTLDDNIDEDYEINEVNAVQLVKSLFPSLGAVIPL